MEKKTPFSTLSASCVPLYFQELKTLKIFKVWKEMKNP